jgi:hypothetical protein
VVQIIKTAMARESERRYHDCLTFRDSLSAQSQGLTGTTYHQPKMSPVSQTAVQTALATDTQTPLEMTRSGGVAVRKSNLALILGGITALSAVVAVAALLVFGGSSEPENQTEVPVSPTAPTGLVAEKSPDTPKKPEEVKPEETKADMVTLKIAAIPSSAQISIDGIQKEGNPFENKVLKDDIEHKIEVRAVGYNPETRNAKFDGDRTLEIKLKKAKEKKKKKKKVAKKSRKDTKRTTKSDAMKTDTKKTKDTKKPRRQIDDADPWRK